MQAYDDMYAGVQWMNQAPVIHGILLLFAAPHRFRYHVTVVKFPGR